MKVLVTGSSGFIGKNLLVHLKYTTNYEVITFNRNDNQTDLRDKIKKSNFIFHLAGVNRPETENEFSENASLTKKLIKILKEEKLSLPIIYTSSSKIQNNDAYGKSKLHAEELLKNYQKVNKCPVIIYRLTNVFGKWCKPNYNSVVATFCHNIANNLEIRIDDPNSIIKLVYIDDVIKSFLNALEKEKLESDLVYNCISPTYELSLSQLAEKIYSYKSFQDNLITQPVGHGIDRALYSTYLSYLVKNKFSHNLKENIDKRGKFVEVLKTKNSGQISFLISPPGETRGCHFHHTKTEKFIVISGNARIKFRNLLNDDTHEIICSEKKSEVINTIPGWVHDITNIGDKDLAVLIWSNEIFDQENPDTYYEEV
tara:strand:- start:1313 stop:2422 length:1110 start_codon:yes stop_codon:yes gene_type:complete